MAGPRNQMSWHRQRVVGCTADLGASPSRGCSQKAGRRDARALSVATDDTPSVTMNSNGAPKSTLTGMASQHVALERKDYASFVTFFRQASPYIEGHRGRTFVVVVPGEVRCTQRAVCAHPTPRTQVVDHKDMLTGLLEDISLLHGMALACMPNCAHVHDQAWACGWCWWWVPARKSTARCSNLGTCRSTPTACA